MGILTMPSIAVCLMFQRHNLYTIKLKSLAAIKSVTKTFFVLLIRKEILLVIRSFLTNDCDKLMEMDRHKLCQCDGT